MSQRLIDFDTHLDNSSTSVAKNVAFHCLMESVDTWYNLPSRHYNSVSA